MQIVFLCIPDYILKSFPYAAHASAQAVQAAAHFWQHSCVVCFPHSAAQAVQISVQSLQSAPQ